jgi:hypothetical protein
MKFSQQTFFNLSQSSWQTKTRDSKDFDKIVVQIVSAKTFPTVSCSDTAKLMSSIVIHEPFFKKEENHGDSQLYFYEFIKYLHMIV